MSSEDLGLAFSVDAALADRIESVVANNTALHEAVASGWFDLARNLLLAGEPVDELNGLDRSPLVEAASRGDVAMAVLLLDHDVDPDARDGKAPSPLRAAIDGGHIAMVVLLLARGANPGASDAPLGSVLRLARERGSRDAIAALFLAQEGRCDELHRFVARWQGTSRTEVSGGALGALKRFLRQVEVPAAGESQESAETGEFLQPDVEDHDGEAVSDLENAVRSKDTEWLRGLLQGGADANEWLSDPDGGYDEVPALQQAIGDDFIEGVRLLVSHGAELEDDWHDTDLAAGSTPLVHAIRYSKTDMVAVLLDLGADPNVEADTGMGSLPLDQAIGVGYMRGRFGYDRRRADVVTLLLSAGADIDGTDAGGWTPLMHAADSGDVEAVEYVLSLGANPDVSDPEDGRTAMSIAIRHDHQDVVDLLRNKGAAVRPLAAGADGRSALSQAISGEDWEAVERLLASDIDIVACCKGSASAIGAALGVGNLRLANRLLSADQSIAENLSEDVPAFAEQAIKENRTKALGWLLRHGLDPDAVAPGAAPASLFLIAVGAGHLNCLRAMLKHGASIDAHPPGMTSALWLALYMRYERIADALLDHGADVTSCPDASVGDGLPGCLGLAVNRCFYTVAMRILRGGANPNQDAGKGRSALALLALSGYDDKARRQHGAIEELALEMLQRGVGLEGRLELANHELSGATALVVAAAVGLLGMCRTLIAAGANIEARTSSGATSLIMASQGGHVDVCNLLFDHGVDVDATSPHAPFSALHAATSGERENLMSLLLDCGANVDIDDSEGLTPLLAICATSPRGDVRVEPDRVLGGIPIMREDRGGDHVDVVARLLAAGARTDVISRKGQGCLALAVAAGNLPLLGHLLHEGVDPGVGGKKGCAMRVAVSGGNVQAVYLLLQHGASTKIAKRPSVSGAEKAGDSKVRAIARLLDFWDAQPANRADELPGA
jgi:ankyrin repeat protein